MTVRNYKLTLEQLRMAAVRVLVLATCMHARLLACWFSILSLSKLFSSNRENTRRGPEIRAKMHWKRLSIQWNLVRSSC